MHEYLFELKNIDEFYQFFWFNFCTQKCPSTLKSIYYYEKTMDKKL